MTPDQYPWRTDRTLGEVLASCRPWLIGKEVIKDAAGYPEDEVASAEQRIGRPLPDDIRAFYHAARPIGDDNGGFRAGVVLYDLDALEWQSMSVHQQEPLDDWARAEGLWFGCIAGGQSALCWVRGHRAHADGCIVLVDPLSYMTLGDLSVSVHARSFAEFIAKLVALNGLWPGCGDDDGMDWDEESREWVFEEDKPPIEHGEPVLTEAEATELFLAEYAELNPISKVRRST